MPKKHPKTDYQRYGKVFLFVGLACLVIALAINFIFIKPTNFKQEFQERQYAACIKNGTDQSVCSEHFHHWLPN